MTFQDPNTTLNPIFDVGEQIGESLRIHDDPDSQGLLDYLHAPLFNRRSTWREMRERAIDLMEQVGIASANERVSAYPHELSGGMCQRAMLAIALAGDPDLLIADEPTTALDTTTQAEILDLLQQLNTERGMAVLLITHDLGVIAEICDRVVVLYAGEVMETGSTERILTDPRHPYTRALLGCLTQRADRKTELPSIGGKVPNLMGEQTGCPFAPRCEYATDACTTVDPPTIEFEDGSATCGEPIIFESESNESTTPTTETGGLQSNSLATGKRDSLFELRNVSKRFALSDSLLDRIVGEPRYVRAVSDVDLMINKGETVGLVGESGSGKSTLAALVAGLVSPTSGTVRFDGERVGTVEARSKKSLADVGFVFQNPRSSLDPRMTVRKSVEEPMYEANWDRERRSGRVAELFERVGLADRHMESYPHQLSGGQIQRVAIARALALDPRLVILDEPTSALDVSVQARILNLLSSLQDDLDLTYLFVSHDLDVVNHIADRVAVMYLGELMEVGPTSAVFDRPSHPYTEALIDAIPSVDPGTPTGISLGGEVPSAVDPPSGCVFHPRCPMAEPECKKRNPPVIDVGETRSRCHFAESVGDHLEATQDDVEVPDVSDP